VDRSRWRIVSPLAELAGTALVIAALVSARVVAWHPDSPVAEKVHGASGRIAIVAGLTGLAIVAVARSPLGRLSGAHLNPAVTVGFGLQGMVAPFELVAYPTAQIGGAVIGAVAAREAWGRSADLPHVVRGLTQPGEGWGTLAVLVGEALVTTLLLLVAFTVLSRHSTLRSASFVVPGALVVAVCACATRTGAGFNPARILGPDVSAGRYPGVGTYLVAPLLGACLAAVLWRSLAGRKVLTPKLDHHPRYPCFFRHCRLHPTAATFDHVVPADGPLLP
jgi:glycerol uptake facilitator-like aquaporin